MTTVEPPIAPQTLNPEGENAADVDEKVHLYRIVREVIDENPKIVGHRETAELVLPKIPDENREALLLDYLTIVVGNVHRTALNSALNNRGQQQLPEPVEETASTDSGSSEPIEDTDNLIDPAPEAVIGPVDLDHPVEHTPTPIPAPIPAPTPPAPSLKRDASRKLRAILSCQVKVGPSKGDRKAFGDCEEADLQFCVDSRDKLIGDIAHQRDHYLYTIKMLRKYNVKKVSELPPEVLL